LIDTILFDWDGTLIDTAEQAFEAFQKSLADLGMALAPEVYEQIYSPNWYSMYEALHLPKEKWEEADDGWLRHYADDRSRLIPGIDAALIELTTRNFALGIVTSGSRSRVLREMDALGLKNAFRVIVCSDDVANKKPHPEGLEIAMKQLEKEPDRCCYIGDSPDDIEMGRRARVLTVAIPGRYPSSRKLPDSRPNLSFSSLEEFVAAVGKPVFMWRRVSRPARA
jgi:HAD superfamily hydrolase (TIGR01549 family)